MNNEEIKNIFNKIVNFYFKNGNEVDLFINGFYICLNDKKDRLLIKGNKNINIYKSLLFKYNENDMVDLSPEKKKL